LKRGRAEGDWKKASEHVRKSRGAKKGSPKSDLKTQAGQGAQKKKKKIHPLNNKGNKTMYSSDLLPSARTWRLERQSMERQSLRREGDQRPLTRFNQETPKKGGGKAKQKKMRPTTKTDDVLGGEGV